MKDVKELVAAYFEAVGNGDRAALMELLAPEATYRFPGRSSFGQEYRGRQEILEYLDRLRELTGGTMCVDVRDVFVGSAAGAGWVRAEAEVDGQRFAWNLVGVIQGEQGHITSVALYYDDQYGVDEFLDGGAA